MLSLQNGSLELNLAISPDLLKFVTSPALYFRNHPPSPQLCNWLGAGQWEEAGKQKTKAAAEREPREEREAKQFCHSSCAVSKAAALALALAFYSITLKFLSISRCSLSGEKCVMVWRQYINASMKLIQETSDSWINMALSSFSDSGLFNIQHQDRFRNLLLLFAFFSFSFPLFHEWRM